MTPRQKKLLPSSRHSHPRFHTHTHTVPLRLLCRPEPKPIPKPQTPHSLPRRKRNGCNKWGKRCRGRRGRMKTCSMLRPKNGQLMSHRSRPGWQSRWRGRKGGSNGGAEGEREEGAIGFGVGCFPCCPSVSALSRFPPRPLPPYPPPKPLNPNL